MSTAELKNKLKEKIENLTQDYLLEELLNIIDLESSKSGVINIPDNHKEKLEISLTQIENGQTTSHIQVMKELKDGFAS